MDMTKSNLYREFSKLSLNSIKSVQNGQSLNDLDLYLHVERPVESVLRQKKRHRSMWRGYCPFDRKCWGREVASVKSLEVGV